jgi:hypothetical protein
MDAADRFWAKVDKRTGGCWLWRGAITERGYGQFYWGPGQYRRAHRVSWDLLRGPIPPGLQLDHLCREKLCVNPDHLEPVTARENLARSPLTNGNKTHCPQGHEYTADNTILTKQGKRKCKACAYRWDDAAKARWRRWRDKRLTAHAGMIPR